MQLGVSAFGDDPLSRCVLFDFVETDGAIPTPRWGHSAVLLGDAVYVYGGVGSQTCDDLLCYKLGNTKWELAELTSQQHAPPAMYGQAACGIGNSMYVYGGRQGRKFLHTLYKYSPDSRCWQLCKAGSTVPPALAAHTLTAVGQHGVFCFGGQGKRVYNAVHKLDPSTCRWELVKTIGVQPSPRHGHTAVWDNSDSLIVFGGTNSTGQCVSDVHVLSLSTGFWSHPQCTGDIPRARANHTAVMWTSHLMLVFGGCNPTLAGRFMNDVHVLDITTWMWHQLDSIGTPPASRYWHTCVVTEGRALVFGGSNATQIFDRLFTISSDWSREISEVAGELARMSNQSNGRTQAPSALQMSMQLGDMLEQKAYQGAANEEAHRHKHTRMLLQEERLKVKNLAAEVAQLHLLQEEQQDKHEKERADAQSKVHRLEEQCQQLTSSMCSVQIRNEELLTSIQQHTAQSAEHASLRPALASMQQQQDTLRNQCQESQDQYRQLHKQHQDSLHQHRALQEQYQALQDQLSKTSEDLESSKKHAEQLQYMMSTKKPQQLSLQADSSSPIAQPGNASTQHQGTNYLRHPFWSSQPETSCFPSNLKQITEPYEGLLTTRGLQDAAAQLAVSTIDTASLQRLSVAELHSLESTCQALLSNVIAASRHKAYAEVSQLTLLVAQLERTAEDRKVCPLCMEADKEIVLNCGHQMCQSCRESLTQCPFCSIPISVCIRMY